MPAFETFTTVLVLAVGVAVAYLAANAPVVEKEYATFEQFYPFYLTQHSDVICRRLHNVGSTLSLLLALFAVSSRRYVLLPYALILGYAFAWVGHYFFEHNKPATFNYPVYSFMGDWVMLKDVITGKLAW